MRKSERAKIVKQVLDTHFPNPKPPLLYKDAFTFLIAVLLSAQCTDVRVNRVTPVLFKKADTPEKMAALAVHEIEKIIRPCGLATRKAQAIHDLSEQILTRHGGLVPATFQELEALKGIGHKSASVVMSHQFNQPAFPVDTHIHRCAKRWGLSDGSSVKKTERDLKKLFCKEDWGKLHLQIILFARRYCKAAGHRVTECPICSKLKEREPIL